MDAVLSPLRTVTIQPFLFEATARPAPQLVAKVIGKYQRQDLWSRRRQKFVGKHWSRAWPPEFPPSLAARLIGQAGFRLQRLMNGNMCVLEECDRCFTAEMLPLEKTKTSGSMRVQGKRK